MGRRKFESLKEILDMTRGLRFVPGPLFPGDLSEPPRPGPKIKDALIKPFHRFGYLNNGEIREAVRGRLLALLEACHAERDMMLAAHQTGKPFLPTPLAIAGLRFCHDITVYERYLTGHVGEDTLFGSFREWRVPMPDRENGGVLRDSSGTICSIHRPPLVVRNIRGSIHRESRYMRLEAGEYDLTREDPPWLADLVRRCEEFERVEQPRRQERLYEDRLLIRMFQQQEREAAQLEEQEGGQEGESA
ncbi:hypothetical protein QBC46DRAFT_347919 [Diplogelasinospora grovesii]|uniref:Uncharacterized protein n=1 Tax=Diplogelasinospora grovesii TaxID=303347 RepID=A0AAN6MW58_9PEZI|nr:hypothetical protein QBC46DRAFT_347919 [Diplogelasinospora grovesii]